MKATKIMLLITALAMVLGMVGCNSTKRAARLWQKSYRVDKETNASLCAATYNPIDSIHEKITYLQGETMVLIDTLYDTVYNDTGSIVTKVLLKTISRIDTQAVVKYVQEVNNAKLVAKDEAHKKELEAKDEQIRKLSGDNRNLTKNLSAMEAKRDNWRKLAWIAWGLIALYFILKYGIKAFKSWVLPAKGVL